MTRPATNSRRVFIPPTKRKRMVFRHDLADRRFGRLVAVERAGTKWVCRCDCGTQSIIATGQLVSGKTQSCGCLQSERAADSNRRRRLTNEVREARAFQRFHNLYIPEPNSGCWIWIGSIASNGYGRFGHHIHGTIFAHRASYLLLKGDIPPRQHVCHRCDIRSCVNPDHLWLGTARDNIHDCIAKGRAWFTSIGVAQ